MPTPRQMGQQHGRVFRIRLHRVEPGDVIPVHDLGGTTGDVVVIEGLDDANFAIEPLLVNVLLGVPDGFVVGVADFSGVGGRGDFG